MPSPEQMALKLLEEAWDSIGSGLTLLWWIRR